MYWYNIYKINDEYMIVKTVEYNHSIGTKRKFAGTRQECIEYCRAQGIKLGKNNKTKID